MRARYQNIGALGVEGIDTAIRWAAGFSDLGLESIPGQLSLSVGGNFLLDQSQPVSVGGRIRNFAGYVGASRFRSNTVLGWSRRRHACAADVALSQGHERPAGQQQPEPDHRRLSRPTISST